MKVKQVDLWYPGVAGPESVDAIEIELVHVRAARSIRVTYDFDRDGYVISAQPDPGDGEFGGDLALEAPYQAKAFVPAWEEELESKPTADDLLGSVLDNAEVYAALPPSLLEALRRHLGR